MQLNFYIDSREMCQSLSTDERHFTLQIQAYQSGDVMFMIKKRQQTVSNTYTVVLLRPSQSHERNYIQARVDDFLTCRIDEADGYNEQKTVCLREAKGFLDAL